MQVRECQVQTKRWIRQKVLPVQATEIQRTVLRLKDGRELSREESGVGNI